ncbi:MAG: carboxypeptidase regulatory-like domain-containing protein [Planctomycetes bacterium]|nr:carboxypeptidase regulatory-like domain-containing protein [Planctomycetota bacterium]
MRTPVALFALLVLVGAGIVCGLLVVGDSGPPPLEPPSDAPAPAPAPAGPARAVASPAPPPVSAATPPEPFPLEPPVPSGPPLDPSLPRVVSSFREIPVVGARVRVRMASGEEERDTTDRHGQFAAGLGRAAAVAVHVEADGFQPLEAAVEGPLEGKRFALEPAGVISGRVVDRQRVPQAWAKIQAGVVIEDAQGATVGVPWPDATGVVSDLEGCFRLERLDPRGRYLVAASLARLGVDVVTDVAPAAPAPGPLVTLRLGGEASIHAEVVDAAGNAVFGPQVLLSGRPDHLPGGVVADAPSRAVADIMRALDIRLVRNTYSVAIPGTAGKSGFVFEQLPAGRYRLEVSARGYKPYATSLGVGAREAVQHVAKLELEDVALTGLVTDSAGRAVLAANVSVHTGGSPHAGYLPTATGPDGSFAVRGPAEWLAPLALHVSADGFEALLVEVPPGRKSVVVKLYRTGIIWGDVEIEGEETGEVVFDFVRSVPQAAQERRVHAVRHLWKRFRFTLPHGEWSMRVTAPGCEPYVGQVKIVEGGDTGGFRIVLRKR